MFAENLRKAMDTLGMSATELARATGIGNSAISQYLSGKNMPKRDKIEKFAEALRVPVAALVAEPEKEEEPRRMTVKRAARLMGVSEQFIRIGLQRELLPFGFALLSAPGGKRFEYYISPKQFQNYTGINLELTEEDDGSAEDIL